jgi:uncharacterized protein
MPITKTTTIALAVTGITSLAALGAVSQLDAIGAGALLFPYRQITRVETPSSCERRTLRGEDVDLAAWHCATTVTPRRGTIIYLHGIGDNRGTAVGLVDRFVRGGFDLVAFDARAHGDSGGDRWTYGYYEKRDLRRVIDQIGADRVVVIGHSLGAAVALQAAPLDQRIRAVVAVATFSDLRTIATERAPFVFTPRLIAGAFARAERDGNFKVDDVSPLKAAALITVPVLLVHGENDHNTPPAHSWRVFEALRGPKKLLVVPGAGHNDVLNGGAWREIESWLANTL